MVANLVSTAPTRFSVIRPELLGTMKVLETIDTDTNIADRMAKLVEIWNSYDPPIAAAYDVGSLEFDPLKIQAELAAYFEALVRDRVNQSARAITLAYATGTDLDAIATRYPYGVPRKTVALGTWNGPGDQEPDATYRQRIWNSPNIFSLSGPGQGVYESYVFWALSTPMPTGESSLKHASAFTRRATGEVIIKLMSDSVMNEAWTVSSDGKTWSMDTGISPEPTSLQISSVYEYVTAADMARQGLTDIVMVSRPKVTNTTIDAEIKLFPGVDRDTLMGEIADAVWELVDALRWLGADLTQLSLRGAFAQAGVYNVTLKSPTTDLITGLDGCINVTSIRLVYKGTGE